MFAQIERSVVANNGDDGIRISAQQDAKLGATVTRNAITRNAVNGISVNGPGFLQATLSENSILHHQEIGVHANGTGTLVWMTANSLAQNRDTLIAEVAASNGAVIHTAGNNAGVTTAAAIPILGPLF